MNGHQSDNWVAPAGESVTANPAGLAAGVYTGAITITAPAASNSPVTVPVTMTILTPLQITTTSLPVATWGQSYSYQLQATGGSGYTWSLQSGSSLPLNLSLSSSGLISGALVSASSTNTYSFTVLVTDSIGRSTYANLSIKVQAPIVITTNAPTSFQFIVGLTYVAPPSGSNSITFQASGGAAPYTWSATGLPSGLNMDAPSGTIVGTPTQPGTFSATIIATDSQGRSGSQAFTLNVTVTTLAITGATGGLLALSSGTVGSPYSQFLNAYGGSNSGYSWSVTSGSLPPGLSGSPVSSNPSCGTACGFQISGTPTQGGSYAFTVKVTDSLNDVATASITLLINSGTPPKITTGTLTLATVGQTYSFPFAATGGTPPYQWSLASASPDPSLQLSSSGVLSGTSTVPNDCLTGPAMWIGTQYPSAAFQVKVTDSASQSSAGQFCLPAYYPTPQVTGYTPPSVVVDSQTHAITVNGVNFRSGATLYTAGVGPLVTTFVSGSALSFTLSPKSNAAFGLGEGGHAFWVVQPYSYASNQDKTFSIYDPPPTVSGVQAVLNNSTQPCTANVNCQLVISGSGFVISTQYQIGQTNLLAAQYPSTPIPWGTVTTSAFSLPAGTYTLTVTNSNQPGGGTASATFQFTVTQ